MKNVNGEEINEELFLKKASEQLSDINEMLEESDLTYTQQEKLVRQITEYGMTMYAYGGFKANEIQR